MPSILFLQALCPHFELLSFSFPPQEEQILCLCQKAANTSPSSWTCLSSLASLFQRGNQSISQHPKVCSQQHGIKGRAQGEGGCFFCGLNSVHPSKEGVNVLPVSHPCESHLFNLMRKLTVHCDQQSLSCSVSPRSYKTASFAPILRYLQLERMGTEGTQLNLKQDAFLSDLAFTIDRGTQTSLTGYTRHLAAWQSFVPHRDQSKQQRDLSGKRGISCFLQV